MLDPKGQVSGTLAQVEIECSDCHGTPKRYPWELPLGVGEEHVANRLVPRSADGERDRPEGRLKPVDWAR